MSIPNEYKYGNYTAKGWILKSAESAFTAYLRENPTVSGNMADVVVGGKRCMDALESAIWAAFDAKEEIGNA